MQESTPISLHFPCALLSVLRLRTHWIGLTDYSLNVFTLTPLINMISSSGQEFTVLE